MKIIIVGAGVAGLSTYLHLRKNLPSNIEITIYESHHSRADTDMNNDEITFESLSNSTQLVGGALGVGPNGMRILNDLDPTIHDEVVRQGFVVHNAIFRSARGWTLSKIGWGDQRQPEEFCVSILRHRLWAILKSKVGEGVIKYRRVRKVNVKEGWGAVVCFEEGVDDEVADLVIGADGVKSTVRRAIFGDEYGPVYEYVVNAFLRWIYHTDNDMQRLAWSRRLHRRPNPTHRPEKQSHGLHLWAKRILRLQCERRQGNNVVVNMRSRDAGEDAGRSRGHACSAPVPTLHVEGSYHSRCIGEGKRRLHLPDVDDSAAATLGHEWTGVGRRRRTWLATNVGTGK